MEVTTKEVTEPLTLQALLGNNKQLVVAERKELTLPKTVKPDEEIKLRSEADLILQKIEEGLGDPSLSLELSNFGRDDQKSVADNIDLLDTPMRQVLGNFQGETGKTKTVPQTLVEYRSQLEGLNPGSIEKKWWAKGLSWVPVVGPFIVNRLIGSKLRELYFENESIRQNVNGTVKLLLDQCDKVLGTAVSLSKVYKNVETANIGVAKRAYQGEYILEGMIRKMNEAKGTPNEVLWRELASRWASRVQNMRLSEQSNLQSMSGVSTTITNLGDLRTAIDDMIIIGEPMLKTSMALRVGISVAQQGIEAIKTTGEFLGDTLLSNAQMIKKQTITIAEIRKNPLIALSKVKASYDELMSALDVAEKSAGEVLVSAQSGMQQLKGMSDELSKRLQKDKVNVRASNLLNGGGNS